MAKATEPPVRLHLASLVEDCRRHGQQIAIVRRQGLRKQSVSYQALALLAGRFAAELSARGIGKGDRVLIWGDNGPEWVAAFFGCLLRGVVAVPIDVAGSASFAQRVTHEVSPKLVAGSREQLLLLPTGVARIDFENFATDLAREPLARPVEGLGESDALQIVFTSGTTGEPKGVVHTNGNILASLRPIEREMQKYLKYERIFHPLRFLHTLPLSHVFGQFMGVWIPILLAAEVHFESRMVPSELVETIRRERISVLVAVPRVLEILETYLSSRFRNLAERLERTKSVRAWRRWWMFRDVHRALGFKFWALICGGATLPERLEHFWNTLGLVVIQGYGMTETAALVSLNHPFHAARGTIGKVLPGREIRLGDDGEILVRGDTVSKATWEGGKLQSRTSDWLATGDLATVDEGGNLKFRGRKKDVIVTSAGLNIYPEDLEAALLRQPQIQAAAVVESVGPRGSEPLGALVPRAGGDAAAAVRAANQELAEYQQIRRWVIWPDPDFPRTSTGKILRREVEVALRGVASGDKQPPSSGMLEGLIAKVTGETMGQIPDSALLSEDLHLDSLGRVELQSMIETQLGIAIDDNAYLSVRTLGELKALFAGPSVSVELSTPSVSPEEHVFPQWPWGGIQQAIRAVFIEMVMRPLVAMLGNPRVRSDLQEQLSRPVLIVANHVTAYDVPLILYALPSNVRRRIAVAMAGEMLLNWRKARGQDNAFLNLVAPIQYFLVTAWFNVFPLPQTSNFRKSFSHAGRAMDAGYHVLVFPEGRRTPDGEMHTFQSGSGMLWKELRTPALPVYLGGTDTRKWFRTGRLSIRIGQLIPFNPDLDAAEAARLLEQEVRRIGYSVARTS